MNDKQLQDHIKKMAETISVPDSLKPEEIEKKLSHQSQKKSSPFFHRRNLVAAAGLLLLLTAAVAAGHYFFQKPATTPEPTTVADNTTASVDKLSYKEAYTAISSYYEQQKATLNGDADIMYEDMAQEDTSGSNDSRTKSKAVQEKEYTNTDTQVNGVMEGDIVKTDGSYLYSLHEEPTGCGITIYSVNGEKVKKVSNISTDQSSISEMYLEGNRLILIGNLWESARSESSQDAQTTQITIYDVSDPAKPNELRTQSQSGAYTTSRVSGDYLYTFSKYSALPEIDKDQPETYIPKINDTVLPEEKVRCIDKAPQKDYMVMTSLRVDGSGNYTDTLSTLGGADVYYVSNDTIYNTENISGVLGNFTKISKYLYKGGKFTFKASCQVRGSIQNSYYLHEQDGNLCFVYNKTTLSNRVTNGLCVLDSDLKFLGEISNLGNDERIYASYFMENTAYFVTYRETDPVFAVDLSNPAKPKLKSELKLPGYSDYLHSFGDNQLVGIGIDEYDFDECVKVSVFSVSKKKKVTEAAKERLKQYDGTTAEKERHSVLIDEERQLVGFPAFNWSSDNADYLLYSYDRKTKTFTRLMRQKNISSQTRGLRIGDYFYVVDSESGITSYKFSKDGKCKKPLSFVKNK